MMSGDYGIKRSLSELNSIFSCQWSNGMLPQTRFAPVPHGQRPYRPDAGDWSVPPGVSGPTSMPTSGITQPPVVGWCVLEVFRRIPPSVRLYYHDEFTRMALALQDYHDWLFRERDPHRENLVVCIHPWETGMDNSPAFIPLLKTVHAFLAGASKFLPPLDFRRADTVHVKAQERPTGQDYAAFVGLLSLFRFHQYNFDAVLGTTPFLIQDVLFNSTLCASVRALARLQEELAQNSSAEAKLLLREQSRRNESRASEVAAAIRTKLWDRSSGYFFAFDLRGGALLDTPTVASFAPLMGGVASEEQSARLIGHLLDADGFGGCLPISSAAPGQPLFDPVRYWSGPVWPITNRLIWQGLRERQSELAERVRSSTLQMIAEGVPLEEVADLAMQVMEANSAGRGGEEYTTPSMRQYHHAWLWDSAIAAVGWLYVSKKPKRTASDGLRPGFWEYYHPVTGAPLGSAHMTWTAAIFLDLFFANA